MLSRLSILQKTIAGFAIILLLMAISTGVAWYGIRDASQGFSRYRSLARDSNFCADITDRVMQMRVIAKNFDISGDAKFIEQFNEKRGEVDALIAEADQRIVAPERRKLLDDMRTSVVAYYAAFSEIIACREVRDTQRSAVLDQEGPKMVQQLKSMITSAQSDQDAIAASLAGVTLNDLMNARLNVFKLITTKEPKFDAETHRALDAFSGNLSLLESEIQNPERQQQLAAIQQESGAYEQAYIKMAAALSKERELVAGKLDVFGPQIASLAGRLNGEIVQEQDGLGPEVEASNQATLLSVAIVSFGALVLGLAIAVLQSRSIVLPIRRVMNILGAISGGDLRQRLEITSQDEVGKMSHSVNHMVDNLQRAMAALAKNSQAIARSAEDMSTTADTMANVSSDTKTQSTSAAAATEQLSINMRKLSDSASEMSTNMDTVASAVEEMSISITQIANSMDQVSHIATEAHQLSDDSRGLLEELNSAANEIGDVVVLIQDIAEQTNLLALNATIEAARAGEAGKGFSVVAGEVKELARQTGNATGDIENRVNRIQLTSTQSIQANDSIRHVVERLNQISQDVAAAVEEQSATTQEIAHSVAMANSAVQSVSSSVNESASAGEEIARSVTSVDRGAQRVSDGANQTKCHSGALNGISSELQTLVGQFQV
ncbi:methyl-accepting chemotaxis protein [Blastopirellula marina]|uniref:Methyl-accepting chemotaxis protein n=1 Tax=Blastopirellula marina TaxID=124 RepID=A0A2S8F885_9BACT|nr:methyl-accepting chemotaxis protein [Blastopirellula marina]PQO28369.1 hypothetical protein C5Y98_26105 [Blastopirellula marina]PTL41909.1 methyl-accepting chemotaxis protein [Blastopirellula marina]